MARAAARGAESEILCGRGRLKFSLGRYTYQLAQNATGSVYSVSDGERAISEPILWAFGAGQVGQTYLLRRNEAYFESRLSYYSTLQGLDFTTGHPRGAPGYLEDAVGRPVDAAETPRCFACHNTAAVTSNRFDPSHLIPGVTCEACHGPGARHVEAIKAGRLQRGENLILNPVRLKPADSVDFCGACHRTWWDVKLMGLTGPANVRFQPYRVENSRCWNKDDARITCLACHDPHRALERNSASYDDRCLWCHASTTVQRDPELLSKGHASRRDTKRTRQHPGRACPVSTRNCVTCHMPKVELPDMHFKFTDHEIRIARAGEPYPD